MLPYSANLQRQQQQLKFEVTIRRICDCGPSLGKVQRREQHIKCESMVQEAWLCVKLIDVKVSEAMS